LVGSRTSGTRRRRKGLGVQLRIRARSCIVALKVFAKTAEAALGFPPGASLLAGHGIAIEHAEPLFGGGKVDTLASLGCSPASHRGSIQN